MKTLKLYLLAGLVMGFAAGCQEEDPVEKDLDKFSELVEETEDDLQDDEFNKDWESVRSNYIDLKSDLVDKQEKMSEEQKKEYQNTVDQWNQVAEQYYLMDDLETNIDKRDQANMPNEQDENLSNSATNNYTNETVDDYDEVRSEQEEHGSDDAYNRTDKTDDYQNDQKTTGEYDYDPNSDGNNQSANNNEADNNMSGGNDTEANMDNNSTSTSAPVRDLYSILNVDVGTKTVNLDNVNQSNIVDIYKRFTDNVQQNRKQYNSRDWEQVDILWQALNDRKDALDEDMETRSKLDIAEYKLEYAAYKTIRKPSQQVEEKVDEKTSQH